MNLWLVFLSQNSFLAAGCLFANFEALCLDSSSLQCEAHAHGSSCSGTQQHEQLTAQQHKAVLKKQYRNIRNGTTHLLIAYILCISGCWIPYYMLSFFWDALCGLPVDQLSVMTATPAYTFRAAVYIRQCGNKANSDSIGYYLTIFVSKLGMTCARLSTAWARYPLAISLCWDC